MIVGLMEIRLHLPDTRTRKDKRNVLRALKDRVRGRFNVSIAEVGEHDMIQSAVLAVAQVGSDSRYINGALDQVLRAVQAEPGARVVDHTLQML